jgi:MFS family permease
MPAPTPLPTRKLAIVSLILFANNASIWMIFSFLPFMVLYYYPDTDPSEVGYLAGILGSAFSLGSLCGNFIWGLLADHFGRRSVLLAGLLGTAFSAALFGLSPYFWTAVLARFLWGFLNGNIGVGKTYMAEIHDDTNSAKGMAIFGVIGGLGRTVGPFIGGFLSQPADHYHSMKGTVFETFPFALPSCMVVIFCLIVFVVAYFELAETLPIYSPLITNEEEDEVEKSQHNDRDSSAESQSSVPSHCRNESGGVEMSLFQTLNKYLTPSDYMHLSSNDDVELSNRTDSVVDGGIETDAQKSDLQTKKKRISFNGIVEKQSLESGKCEYSSLKSIEDDRSDPRNDCHDIETGISPQDFHHPTLRFSNGAELITPEIENDYYSSRWRQLWYFFRTKMIVTSLLLYGLLSLVHVVAVEIFPLWLVVPSEKGGFGFSSSQIGLMITLTGPVNILSQLFVYPYFVEKYGPLHVFRMGITMYALCAFLLPVCTAGSLREMNLLSTVLVAVGNSLLTSAAGWCFICVFVFINNSCYSHQRGKVNGLGQSCASLGRLVGPICGSSLFAWTTHQNHWPFNYGLTWYVIGCGAICIWKLSARLPKKIVKRRREPRVPRYALSMMKATNDLE